MLLLTGTNQFAVEVHQNSTTSSDVSFDLEFSAQSVTPAPALGATLSGGNQFTLIWPGWAAGYAMFTATNLAPPTAWVPLTNAPMLIGNEWRVTLPAGTTGTRFFKLQHP